MNAADDLKQIVILVYRHDNSTIIMTNDKLKYQETNTFHTFVVVVVIFIVEVIAVDYTTRIDRIRPSKLCAFRKAGRQSAKHIFGYFCIPRMATFRKSILFHLSMQWHTRFYYFWDFTMFCFGTIFDDGLRSCHSQRITTDSEEKQKIKGNKKKHSEDETRNAGENIR